MSHIANGTRLIEYLGERITHEEADERYDDDAMERPHTFLFAVDRKSVIDAAKQGNEARFINHSCDPNCEAIVEKGRVFIEAIRDIPAGEELTYDYHLERPGRSREEWKQRYACRCGAPTCRGTLLEPRRRRVRRKASVEYHKPRLESRRQGFNQFLRLPTSVGVCYSILSEEARLKGDETRSDCEPNSWNRARS